MLAVSHRMSFFTRRILWSLGLMGVSLVFCGCAGTFDTLMSRRFREEPFHTLFGSDDPMVVLRTSQDNDLRVRAMQDLKEPKRNGLTEQDQNEIIQILTASATTDSHPVCRMTAVETLSRFEDPRISQILVTAYHNAPFDSPKDLPTDPQTGVVQVKHEKRTTPFSATTNFTPDLALQIQMRVLEALGKSRSPAGMALLCEVASAPTRKEMEKKSEMDVFLQSESEQGKFELRLAALRSLANYKGEVAATEVCFNIITTEKDVALRSRAYLALEQITGKKVDATPAAWATALGKQAPETN
jgi:HEAT repeat protein